MKKKLKTLSSAKKRFRTTASGRIKFARVGKRHGMIKRSQKQIRNHRGTACLCAADAKRVRVMLGV